MSAVSDVSSAVQPLTSAEMTPVPDEPEPGPYFARTAICFMPVVEEGDDDALYRDLARALRDDPRVESIDVPDQDEHSFSRPVLSSFGSFSSDYSVEPDEAPDPFSHLHAFTFRRPIIIQVRSPRRLQPKFESSSYVPTERYWAAWNGLALIVLWQFEDQEITGQTGLTSQDLRRALSPSAGLLVQDVLKDAVEKCDNEFRTVECSPNCTYTFSHNDLIIKTLGENGVTRFRDPIEYDIAVDLASSHDPAKAVRALYWATAFISGMFARIRSDGETMESAAWQAHIDVSRLLELNYDRAAASAKPFFKSLRERWNMRGSRREERKLVARISLGLATIEHVRAGWSRTRKVYEDSAQRGNVGVIFGHEYGLSQNAISAIELTEAHAAIERVTGSLDTRALVLVTAIASIIGAIIGALIATFA